MHMREELLSLSELEILDYAKISWGLGIRTDRNSNISLLGKHVWDILHQPQKLWVKCLGTNTCLTLIFCILILSLMILAFGVLL